MALNQQEINIKAQAVQVDNLKVQAMAQSDADKHAIQQEAHRMKGILDIQKLELENMRVRLAESEKLMEERRLASEQQLERIRLQMERLSTPKETTAPAQQPVVINNIIPKRGKRVASMINDELGNLSGIEVNDADEGD